MGKQVFEDKVTLAKQALANAEDAISEANEFMSEKQSELDAVTSELMETEKAKHELYQYCLHTAEEFSADTNDRDKELTALSTAKKVIMESMPEEAPSQEDASTDVSLFQMASVSTMTARESARGFQVVKLVRHLAHVGKSNALLQLAGRMARVMRRSTGGEDPFVKLKDMISEMILKLEEEQ